MVLTITGGQPNQPVLVDGWSDGNWQTDGNGYFSLSGTTSSDQIGHWDEVWTVGSETASPDLLSFDVHDCTGYCDGSVTLPGANLYSIDFFSFGTYLYSQSDPASASSGVTPGAPRCTLFSSNSWTYYGLWDATASKATDSISWSLQTTQNCSYGGSPPFRPCSDPYWYYYYPLYDYISLEADYYDNWYGQLSSEPVGGAIIWVSGKGSGLALAGG